MAIKTSVMIVESIPLISTGYYLATNRCKGRKMTEEHDGDYDRRHIWEEDDADEHEAADQKSRRKKVIAAMFFSLVVGTMFHILVI